MIKKLLPCPFCGGEAELVGDNYHWVLCKGCLGGSHAFETAEDAIKAWNTRKPMERILERFEELKGSYKEQEEDARRSKCPNISEHALSASMYIRCCN